MSKLLKNVIKGILTMIPGGETLHPEAGHWRNKFSALLL